MNDAAPEYIAARGVLLDALHALVDHRSSLVLVGAQAVYLHTGPVAGTGIQMTTDSDLALDADLLTDDPELTATLRAANFTSVPNLPGQWESPMGIRVDLMTVPHQSNRDKGKRAADLAPHGKETARITPGLEPALVDNSTMLVPALADDDDRAVLLRVAGPAALLSAKLTKLRERYEDVLRGRGKTRLKEKDVLDCYRILMKIETSALVTGFESHRVSVEALEVTRTALRFFDEQFQLSADGALRNLLITALPGDSVAPGSFDALSEDLITALPNDLF